jgi:hypothetical protein
MSRGDHALKGFVPTRYAVHVNGPRCITFEFDRGNGPNIWLGMQIAYDL